MRGPDDVDAHPSGASPFGVMDLTGNVYQWTNEFKDLHTRAASIRGGNYYQPQGSMWYQPQSYPLNQHTKYLLMSPTMDRSGGIGFRCVVDAPARPPPPCTSPICGKIQQEPKVIDLTALGKTDWKHWGLRTATDVDRKATGGNKITAVVIGGNPLQYGNNDNGYSWSDGTPTVRVTNTITGIYIAGKGNGFKITVPATTTKQTLYLYVGLWQSQATLEVSLSNTPGGYTNTQQGSLDVCYVIEFTASSNDQNLVLSWTQDDNGGGNVTLQAAVLE